MQFKTSIAGVAAFALSVAAQSSQVLFTQTPNSAKAGEPTKIGYSSKGGQPVTILLKKGDSDNLSTVSVLTSSSTGGSYNWTPSESLKDGDDYALEIKQGGEINYSGQFTVSGGSGAGDKKPSPPKYEKPEENSSAPSHRSTEAPSSHGGYVKPAPVPGCHASQIGDNQVQYPKYCTSLATSAKPTHAPYSSPSKAPYVYPSKSAHGPANTYAPPPAPVPSPSKAPYNPPAKPAPSATGGEEPAGTSSGAQATSTGGAATIGSSMALVMGAFAAVAFFN